MEDIWSDVCCLACNVILKRYCKEVSIKLLKHTISYIPTTLRFKKSTLTTIIRKQNPC